MSEPVDVARLLEWDAAMERHGIPREDRAALAAPQQVVLDGLARVEAKLDALIAGLTARGSL